MQHQAAVAPDPNPSPVDPVYLIRDSLFREYQPATECEKMLVTVLAQAYLRLQRAHDAENRLFAETDILALLKSDRDAFQTISRYIVDCERAWRRAMEELHRLQRQRLGPHHLRVAPSRQATPARSASPPSTDRSTPAAISPSAAPTARGS